MRLAFMGKMGAGKTESSNFLQHSYGFKPVSFAGLLKMIEHAGTVAFTTHNDVYAVTLHYAEIAFPDPIYGKTLFSGRTAREYVAKKWERIIRTVPGRRARLQQIGTDVGRAMNPEVWINYTARHLPTGDLTVDDLRFKNEVQALRDLGFIIVKLDVAEHLRVERLVSRDGFFDPDTQGHSSETELDDVEPDVWIDNDGDLKTLHNSIEEVREEALVSP